MQARRYLTGITFLGVILAALVLRNLLGGAEIPDFIRPIGGDFLNVWAAPHLPLHALFDTSRYMAQIAPLFDQPLADHNWSYPLYALWLFAPFSWLPYAAALALWSILGFALCLYAMRHALARPLTTTDWLTLALAPAAIVNLYTGQNGFFTAALALLALTRLRTRPYLAGILIGLLCFKPHLGLLWPVALLSIRAWRSIAAAAITVLLLAGLSWAIHGADAWDAYFTATAAMQWALITDIPQAGEPCCFTYQLMMVGPLPALRFLGIGLDTGMLIQALITLAVAALCYRYFPRLSLAGRTVLLGAGTLLALPYGYNYDLMLLMSGMLLYWNAHPPVTPAERWMGGAAYLAPLLVYTFNSQHVPLTPLALAASLFLVLHGEAKTGYRNNNEHPPMQQRA